MRKSIDIETALYEALTDDKYSASAHKIPETLGQRFPHVHVTRTGGYAYDMVLELHNVDFDVYAADSADAMTAAEDLTDWARELKGTKVGTTCYDAEVTTLPYNNPDPRHPTIARATFKAQLLMRIKEV